MFDDVVVDDDVVDKIFASNLAKLAGKYLPHLAAYYSVKRSPLTWAMALQRRVMLPTAAFTK